MSLNDQVTQTTLILKNILENRPVLKTVELLPQLGLNELRDAEFAKSIIELSFRNCLHEFYSKSTTMEYLLDFSAHLDNDFLFTLSLLDEWAECIPVCDISIVFTYLESHAFFLAKNLSSSKSRGLLILRLCNDILRRLSKSKNASFCGKIILFLFNIFPLSERSGLNLKGDYNLDNVYVTIDQSQNLFFNDFWKMQQFIYNPSQLKSGQNWALMSKTIEQTLFYFKNNKALPRSVVFMESIHPKYLITSDLFESQLIDPIFRNHILIQLLFFLNDLKMSDSNFDDSNQITSTIVKVFEAIKCTNGDDRLNKKIIGTLETELQWKTWKSNSCPSFEGQFDLSNLSNVDQPEIFRHPYSNLFTNTPLYNIQSIEFSLSSLIDGDKESDSTPIIDYLKEQLDPETGIEAEYLASRTELFRWKLSRSLLTSDFIDVENVFQACVSSVQLENLIGNRMSLK